MPGVSGVMWPTGERAGGSDGFPPAHCADSANPANLDVRPGFEPLSPLSLTGECWHGPVPDRNA
ncbi:hypothetical protein EBF04_12130 [Streptomyces sp. I6]|nr:hypothetical protein EBF04_12130 [Streptomyces sp. I6]